MTIAVPATLSSLFPPAAPTGAAADSALSSGVALPPGGFLDELLAWRHAAGRETEIRNSFWPDERPEGLEPGPVSQVPPAAAPPPPEEDGRGRILESAGLGFPPFVAPAVAALATLSASISPADRPLPLEPVLPVSAFSPSPGPGALNAPSPASYGADTATAPPAATPSSGAPVAALGHAGPAARLAGAAPAAGAPPRETPRGELAVAIEATQKPPAGALEASRAPLPSKPPEASAQASAAGARPVSEALPESPTAQLPLPGPAGAESPPAALQRAVEASGDRPFRPHTATMKVRPQAPPEAFAAKGTPAGTPLARAGEAEGESSPEPAGRPARPVRAPEVANPAHGRIRQVRPAGAPRATGIEAARPARASAAADKPAEGLPMPGPGHLRTASGPAGLSNAFPGSAAGPEPAQVVAGEAPLRTAPAAPARRIELRLARPNADILTVEVAERRGRIELAVRTPDRELAASLGEQAAEMVRRLEAAGFRAHVFTPQAPDRALEPRLEAAAETAPGFRERGGDTRQDSGGRNQQGGGQDSDGEFPEENFFSLTAGREEIDR